MLEVKEPTKSRPGRTHTNLHSNYAPRWLIVAVTILSIIFLMTLLALGAYWPQRFQNPIAKFFVCVLLAFCFAIVMFGVYPQIARIKKVPLINLPVELVGPPALFVVALPLLLFIYPNLDQTNRFFFLYEKGTQNRPLTLQLESLEIHALEGNCTYYPAKDPNNEDLLIIGGMYVEFKDEIRCKARVGNSYTSYIFSFDRTARTNVLQSERQDRP